MWWMHGSDMMWEIFWWYWVHQCSPQIHSICQMARVANGKKTMKKQVHWQDCLVISTYFKHISKILVNSGRCSWTGPWTLCRLVWSMSNLDAGLSGVSALGAQHLDRCRMEVAGCFRVEKTTRNGWKLGVPQWIGHLHMYDIYIYTNNGYVVGIFYGIEASFSIWLMGISLKIASIPMD